MITHDGLGKISKAVTTNYVTVSIYYTIALGILIGTLSILGIGLSNESAPQVALLVLCLGAMLGALHRKVFMPANISPFKRWATALGIIVAFGVLFAVLKSIVS